MVKQITYKHKSDLIILHLNKLYWCLIAYKVLHHLASLSQIWFPTSPNTQLVFQCHHALCCYKMCYFFSCFCIWELNLSNSDLVFYHLNSEDELFRNNCFLVDFYYYFSAKLALCWNIWYTWLHTHIHRKSDEIRTNCSVLKFLKNFVGLPKKYFVNFKSLKNIPNYSRYLFYLAFIKLICLDLVKTTQILFIYYF